jgi:nucleoside-diphosphate-sugar epimerase
MHTAASISGHRRQSRTIRSYRGVVRDRKNWVIIGCGYTGARLGRRLAADGCAVVITRRTAAAAADTARAIGPGVVGFALAVEDPAALAERVVPGAAVVIASPPSSDPAGERALIDAAAGAGAARAVYLSSTGVYPASPDGAWMDEDTPPSPTGPRGAARLAAETATLDAAAARGLDAIALRIAGIYGPGRGLAARLRAGSYRIVGAGDSFVSRVHVDDLVSAIIAAGTVDPLPFHLANVADDEPAPSADVADELARALGLPPPPRVSLDDADPDAVAMLTANRRVSNRRLVDGLGVALRYPTWREGMLGGALLEDE